MLNFIILKSSLNKLRIEYNWDTEISLQYERGRKYSTLEGVLFSKLLFERRSICLRHVITTVYRQWFRFLCQRLLGSIQGCFKSHHLKNKHPFIIIIFAVVPKTRYYLTIISRMFKNLRQPARGSCGDLCGQTKVAHDRCQLP